jgi:hypothetical protein
MTLKALPDTALARIWSQPYSAGDQTNSKLTDWLWESTLQELLSPAEISAILHAAPDGGQHLEPSFATSGQSLSVQLDVAQSVVARVLKASVLLAGWNALNRNDDNESVESPAEPNVP